MRKYYFYERRVKNRRQKSRKVPCKVDQAKRCPRPNHDVIGRSDDDGDDDDDDGGGDDDLFGPIVIMLA